METVKLLLVILDGASAEAFESARTPFLDSVRLRDGGIPARVRATLPTITYGNHSTILTGKLPAEHGIVGNLFRDPLSGQVVNLDEHDIGIFLEAPTLFEELTRACAKPPRCVAAAEPVTRGTVAADPMMPYFQLPALARDRAATLSLLRLIGEFTPDLAVVNFLSVDAAGENFGPRSHEYRYVIEAADKLISEMHNAWSKTTGGEIHLLVTADHGMHAVNRRFDTAGALRQANIRCRVAASHRAAHVYLDNPDDTQKAFDVLSESGAFSSIVTRNELDSMNLAHIRSGDIFVLAAPGLELQKDGLRGSHGSLQPEETEVPLIFAGSGWLDVIRRESSFSTLPSLEKLSGLILALFSTAE